MTDKAKLGRAIVKAGGVEYLPEISGPRLEAFHPKGFAAALRSEVSRAKAEGLPSLSIHMDLTNALALARALEMR